MGRRSWIITAIAVVAVLFVIAMSIWGESIFALNLVRTASTLGTLLVAIYLFDKFGIDEEIKSRQLASVLELAEALREPTMLAQSSNREYFLSFRSDQVEHSSVTSKWEEDKDKTLYTDFNKMEEALHPVISFKDDLMIPNDIRKHINDLDPVGLAPVDEYEGEDELILLGFSGDNQENRSSSQNMAIIVPETTLEEYCTKLEKLTQSVQDWLAEHSHVGVDIEQ